MGLTLSAHGKWTAPTIAWDHHTGRGTPYMAYHFATQVAEVEVDMRTGNVQVVGFWAVHDPGKVIFPQGAYGQLYGGIAQGLGYALMEQMTYANGYLQETNFESYLIPTSVDVPEITVQFAEAPFSKGPYGAKNVAEPSMVPSAPAILNAIYHATGTPCARPPGQPGARAAGQGPDEGRVGQGVQAGVEDGLIPATGGQCFGSLLGGACRLPSSRLPKLFLRSGLDQSICVWYSNSRRFLAFQFMTDQAWSRNDAGSERGKIWS